jgi:hypothetical protein
MNNLSGDSMKVFPLKLFAICIGMICVLNAICVLNVNLASAIDQNEVSVSPDWSTVMHYQGDSTSVKLILTNNSSETQTIYYIGIHFDWMGEGFQGLDLSDDPVVVSSHKTYIFEMAINLPENVSVGVHNYTIAVEGTQGETSASFSWDSQPKELYIQNYKAKTFNELLHNVNSILIANVTYQSAEAQNLIEQANNEYTQAVLSSYADQWDDAISHMQNSLSYAEQAEEAEKSSTAQSVDLQRLLWIVAPLATVVIVSFIIILVWKRRQPPDDEVDQPVDQSFDEQPETQDSTPEE